MMATRDRIVDFRRVKASELKPHPMNWRRHPPAQVEALRSSLAAIGYADALIAREAEDGTLELIDGHLRAETTPDEMVPVLVTDLSAGEAKVLLATLDPLAAMADTDKAALDALLKLASDAIPEMEALLREVGDAEGVGWWHETDEDEGYTQTVVSPIYEPTGRQPAVKVLSDRGAADALRERIEDAEVPPAVEAFLLDAAERHVLFDYEQIANYYAHAPAEIQRLMEDSALVIIDYEDAIERGFVRLRADLDKVFGKDYPDA